jgi:hypothetical protein
MTSDEFTNEQLDENLHKWFKEKWVRFGPDGKIRGACARGDDSEGKPKCLPQKKAQNLGKKGRKYAASKKRREDPNPERTGKAKNVATKKKTNEDIPFNECPKCRGPIVHESMMTEKQDACYHKVKSRYKVWPSAYASGALVQCRKKGASNWGTGGKKDESSIMKGIVDEAGSPAQQAAIAISMKKKGQKPKNEGVIIGHDKDDPQVAVLGGAGSYKLSNLKKKALGEAKQLAADIANGEYKNSAYNVKQLANTLNTIVAAEEEMEKLYFGEDYTGEFAAEQTPAINPYGGLKDRKHRGMIGETPTDNPTGASGEGGWRKYKPKLAGEIDEDTAYAGGMGQGGNAGESYRKFKPKSAGTFKEDELDEACWKGYHKEGNKKMFGKTYPNCVKNTNEEQLGELSPELLGRAADKASKISKDLDDKSWAETPFKSGIVYSFEYRGIHGLERFTISAPWDVTANIGAYGERKLFADTEITAKYPNGVTKTGTIKDFPDLVTAMKHYEGGRAYNDKSTKFSTGAANAASRAQAKSSVSDMGMSPAMKRKLGIEEKQLDEKCWDSHKQVGMKNKGGKSVPNCVPKESAILKGFKSL